MRIIRTVRGDIPADQMGVTATHEHLYCDQRRCRGMSGGGHPAGPSPMVLLDVDLVAAELCHYRAAGGSAIAEMTAHGWGRDLSVLKDISERAGVHVIAISGFYVEDCHPPFVADASVESLAQHLIAEITAGAAGTDIRTGLLKASIGQPDIQGQEKKCAVAVARAQRRTGVAITTHSTAAYRFEVENGSPGSLFLDLFESEGVDPARVIIGHVEQNPDVRQLLALARRGASVQFDLVGRSHRILDETRIELLCRLAEAGFVSQLLLSADTCRTTDLKANGGQGYDYLLREFVPRLARAGFDRPLIRRILVENPARVLSIQGPGV